MQKLINEVKSLVSGTVSMEADSTVEVEQELVFYCEIKDIDALKEAAKLTIDQEQWEVKSPTAKGRFRVRVEHFNDGDGLKTEYTCTVKSKNPEGGELETNQPVDEAFFEAVKGLATNGMCKVRYEVPVFVQPCSPAEQNYVWEFDVFEGTEWCKVDLELPTSGDRVRMRTESFMAKLAELPFVGEVIRDEGEHKDFVRKLYGDFFIIDKMKPDSQPSE